jgi:di/tricarboxylate transporter
MVGKTIRDGHFRNRYSAVVIAVGRNGHRLSGRIGDIVLQAGDVLLLEALPAFVEQQRNSNDFYLVSRFEDASPPRHHRGWIAMTITAAMVVVGGVGIVSMLQAAVGAAAMMLITKCCSEETARRRVDWQLLIAIAASFGLGNALTATGAAANIAGSLLSYAGTSPTLALGMVYVLAMVVSGMITNNATAVIMFPIVVSTAQQLGVNHMPFVMALAVASSASFATPLGYQTNLMVWGPGGYRFRDFVRFGLPLSILLCVVALVVIPRAWPF